MSNHDREVIILGNGGEARSLLDIIDRFFNYSVTFQGKIEIGGIVDDTRTLSADNWDEMIKDYKRFLIAVGQIRDPQPRINIYNELHKRGVEPMTIISPIAWVSPRAKIGAGTVIHHQAYVGPFVEIGKCCIINTQALVEHDCKIGDFTHVSTGAKVNGTCKIGNRCFIGSGAIIPNDVNVPDDTFVKAGELYKGTQK